MFKEGTLIFGRELGYADSKHRWRWTKCPTCGRFRWVRNLRCCLERNCRVCNGSIVGSLPKLSGSGNPAWRGGRHKLESGYVSIWIPKNDPFYCMVDKADRLREHRYIIAKHLGRPLESWEIVHHKNSIRDDNRLENLELLGIPRHAPTAIVQSRIKTLEKEVKGLRIQVKLLTWRLNSMERERRYNCAKEESR